MIGSGKGENKGGVEQRDNSDKAEHITGGANGVSLCNIKAVDNKGNRRNGKRDKNKLPHREGDKSRYIRQQGPKKGTYRAVEKICKCGGDDSRKMDNPAKNRND